MRVQRNEDCSSFLRVSGAHDCSYNRTCQCPPLGFSLQEGSHPEEQSAEETRDPTYRIYLLPISEFGLPSGGREVLPKVGGEERWGGGSVEAGDM